ncbi:hypothetical protein [Brachymonas denitrificans]|uniref:hypothetical protein n=1 Tax=Brachymonas denitrificans TaxID=28220 RepID=UPI001BD14BB4|nr:hypothetical protein [Brachymonas denitrificans]
MRYCDEYCINVPDDFPIDELTCFMAAARRILLQPQKGSEWQEFAGASNLIGWRFRAAGEEWENYKRSWNELGVAVPHEGIYVREKALFNMFSAGVSCMDSTAYALAALASHPSVLALPFGAKEQRACSLNRLNDWLAQKAPATGLAAALRTICTSDEWKLWGDLRNRMSHRSNLPRIINASVGAPLPPAMALHFAATSSTPPVEGELPLFDALHTWLAKALQTLLLEGAALCPP